MIKQWDTASLPSEIVIHCHKVLGKFSSHLIDQACSSENLIKENKWNEEVRDEAISLHFKVSFFMIDSVAGRIVVSGFLSWPVACISSSSSPPRFFLWISDFMMASWYSAFSAFLLRIFILLLGHIWLALWGCSFIRKTGTVNYNLLILIFRGENKSP